MATGYGGTSATSIIAEQMGSGTSSVKLDWTATKQATTDIITSVDIDGASQTFTDPAQGASATGSSTITATNNTNKSFVLTVKTKDAKSSSSTASIAFQWKRYWGFMDTKTANGVAFTPSNADILALPNNEFGSSKGVTKSVGAPPIQQKLIIAFPLAWDIGTQIFVGGLDNTSAFDRKVLTNFVNGSNGKIDYVAYVLNNNTIGAMNFVVQ
ncbi:MAG: hypothetical protein NVS3B19_07860 [Ginsengibacter sp.]